MVVRIAAPLRIEGRRRCGRCGERGHNRQTCDRAPVEPAEEAATGFVYFIQATETGRIKIGWTAHVPRRLKALQAHSPVSLSVVATMPGTMRTERRLHREFASSRVRVSNEWFEATPDLLALVGSLRPEAERGR